MHLSIAGGANCRIGDAREEHERLTQPRNDSNAYHLDSINGYNVVISGLSTPGCTAAANVVAQMKMSFQNVKFGLLVGIGGGVPVRTDWGTVRLGDAVVGNRANGYPGTVQYDRGKVEVNSFKCTNSLSPPPPVLLAAVNALESQRDRERDDPVWKAIQMIDTTKRGLPAYIHLDSNYTCDECGCDLSEQVQRPEDNEGDIQYVKVHRENMATGEKEKVIKAAVERDRKAEQCDALCFETEAAGVFTDFHFLDPNMWVAPEDAGVSRLVLGASDDPYHGFLWIKGKPGAGKSTLMKFIVKQAMKIQNRTVIFFFFHARGAALEKTVVGIMDNFEWNDELLKDLFRDAVSRGMLSVIYFIDALDECDESGAREIVKFFIHHLSVKSAIKQNGNFRQTKLQANLHQFFRDILTWDKNKNEEFLLCMQWLLFAKRPLKPRDLHLAILSGTNFNVEDLNSYRRRAIFTPIDTIITSAKDFLLAEDGLELLSPALRTDVLGQSHERLKQCCLNYIETDTISPSGGWRKISSMEEAFPFLVYAYTSVLYHADVAAGAGILHEDFITTIRGDKWQKLSPTILTSKPSPEVCARTSIDRSRTGRQSVARAALYHPPTLIDFLLETRRWTLDSKHDNGRTLLSQVICLRPGTDVVKLLPEKMRRLLSCYFRIPKSILWHRIAEVAHHCHMLFVLGLIMESRRVDPNSRGNSGRTPLSYAAQYGHRHAMKLLLNTSKVDVDSEDNIGRTPLSDAAQYGKQEVIPLLLHTDKVDIDSVDNNNMTPLKYAEKSGIPRLSICCLKFAKLYRIHHSCSMKWVVTCQKTKSIICWFNR
ncbi:hypothetical protein RJ035_002204 [Blastomyces gilchristii]